MLDVARRAKSSKFEERANSGIGQAFAAKHRWAQGDLRRIFIFCFTVEATV